MPRDEPRNQTFTPGASSSRYSDRGSHPGTCGSSYSSDRRGDFRSGGFSRYDDSSDADYYSSHLSRDYYVDGRRGEPRKYADPKNSGRSRSRSSSPIYRPQSSRGNSIWVKLAQIVDSSNWLLKGAPRNLKISTNASWEPNSTLEDLKKLIADGIEEAGSSRSVQFDVYIGGPPEDEQGIKPDSHMIKLTANSVFVNEFTYKAENGQGIFVYYQETLPSILASKPFKAVANVSASQRAISGMAPIFGATSPQPKTEGNGSSVKASKLAALDRLLKTPDYMQVYFVKSDGTVATTDILDEGPFEIGQVVNAKYRNSAMYFSATVIKIIEDAIEVVYSKEEDPTPCFRLVDEDKKVIDITAADITCVLATAGIGATSAAVTAFASPTEPATPAAPVPTAPGCACSTAGDGLCVDAAAAAGQNTSDTATTQAAEGPAPAPVPAPALAALACTCACRGAR